MKDCQQIFKTFEFINPKILYTYLVMAALILFSMFVLLTYLAHPADFKTLTVHGKIILLYLHQSALPTLSAYGA